MSKPHTQNNTPIAPPVARPPSIPYRAEPLFFDTENHPSKTKQSEAAACDINNIVARYQKTGVIDHVSKWGPLYGEIPAVDYHEAQNILRLGAEMYAELPSSVREKFSGPEEFLAFVQTPENQDALEALGLVQKAHPVAIPNPAPIAASEASQGDSEAS